MTGYYALFIQGEPAATPDDIRELNYLKRRFVRQHKYQFILDLEKLYPNIVQSELYKPIASFEDSTDAAKSIYATSRDCFSGMQDLINLGDYEKAYIWEEFRCGKRKYISADFISTPPYLHPSGLSYAYLIFLASETNTNQGLTLSSILPFFHLTELSKVKKKVGVLPKQFDILADLSDLMSTELVQGSSLLISKKHLLIKRGDYFRIGPPSFLVYFKSDLDNFLKKKRFSANETRLDKKCFYRDDGICWNLRLAQKIKLVSPHNWVFLFISIIFTVGVCFLLLRRINAQKLEDAQRRLALQVLSHEFRTPVASLLLSAENISKHIEELDEDLQEELLRLFSSVYRLHRLTETSQNYLRVGPRKSLVHLEFKKITSVNSFVEQIIDPYLDEIEFKPLDPDQAFGLEEYWVAICLKNLIENALNHGQKPIVVSLEFKNNHLFIEVMDQGFLQDGLSNLTQEFYKGSKSEGSGLGLNIVQKVIHAMNGELILKVKPTRFIIKLKDKL
jgi:hypothetical protein